MEEFKKELASILAWHNEQSEQAKSHLSANILLLTVVWLATVCGCCLGIYKQSAKINGTFGLIVYGIIAVVMSGIYIAVLIRNIQAYHIFDMKISIATAEATQALLRRTLGTVHYPPEQPRKKVL